MFSFTDQIKGQITEQKSRKLRSHSWLAPPSCSLGLTNRRYYLGLLECGPLSVSDKGWFVTLKCSSHKAFNALMDRVKYHDLYLSAGCCSCAVNVILKLLYPLFEDLQYCRSHVGLRALKLHYQQPSRLPTTHTHIQTHSHTHTHTHTQPLFSFFAISFKIMKQSAKCLYVTTLGRGKYCGRVLHLSLVPKKLIRKSLARSNIRLDHVRKHTMLQITAWCGLYGNNIGH